LTKEKYFVINH